MIAVSGITFSQSLSQCTEVVPPQRHMRSQLNCSYTSTNYHPPVFRMLPTINHISRNAFFSGFTAHLLPDSSRFSIIIFAFMSTLFYFQSHLFITYAQRKHLNVLSHLATSKSSPVAHDQQIWIIGLMIFVWCHFRVLRC